MTYYGTGCIFHYDDVHTVENQIGFKEADKPNFTGSYYSHSKVSRPAEWPAAKRRLRIRMPFHTAKYVDSFNIWHTASRR